MSSTAFGLLIEKINEIYALRSGLSLMGWDQETYMPTRGGEGRAQAMAALTQVITDKYTHELVGKLLDECNPQDLNAREQALVREFKRDRDLYIRLPNDLSAKIARVTSEAQNVWFQAKKANDAKLFLPTLQKIIELMREKAKALGGEKCMYDTLLDIYEPGCTTKELDPLLTELGKFSHEILEINTSNKKTSQQELLGEKVPSFPLDKQKIFSLQILADMGFNLEAGRLDVSAHPFTDGLHPCDVRLTTRFLENEPLAGLFGTLHEGGHGLYEQGFESSHYLSPMAEAVSLGIHESQSRIWENQVGRSPAFWEYAFPLWCQLFPEQMLGITLEQWLKYVNRVACSYIRVEADEVTYNLHIVLRYKMEKALIEGDLQVADVPPVWDKLAQELLNLEPKEASFGFLQDIHWSAGLIGYFPTYALGSCYAAQLFEAALKAHPGLEREFSAGHFTTFREWLRMNIHSQGREHLPASLMLRATGMKPNVDAFKRHLRKRYTVN